MGSQAVDFPTYTHARMEEKTTEEYLSNIYIVQSNFFQPLTNP